MLNKSCRFLLSGSRANASVAQLAQRQTHTRVKLHAVKTVSYSYSCSRTEEGQLEEGRADLAQDLGGMDRGEGRWSWSHLHTEREGEEERRQKKLCF